jgi:hypothetical protein
MAAVPSGPSFTNKKSERLGKRLCLHYTSISAFTCMDRGKRQKPYTHDSRSPSRGLIRKPPEYKLGLLSRKQERSVICDLNYTRVCLSQTYLNFVLFNS